MGFKIKNSLTGEFEKLPILTLKGEKGETGGVEEYNKVDYMGNKYETLKQANDANVEYAVKTAIGEFNYLDYDGQHITATDTIEGRSKSAILSGNTLVNLIDNGSERKQITYSVETKAKYQFNKDMLVANKTYLLLFTVTDFSGDSFHVSFNNSNQYGVTYLTNVKNGLFKAKVNFTDLTSVTDTLIIYKIRGTALGGYVEKVMLIEYQEGMENLDIPYFEGMQSVKMPVLTTTGKNLFDIENTGFLAKTNINGQTMYSIPNGKTKEFILNHNKLPNIKVSLNCYKEGGDNSSFGRYVYTDGTEGYINPNILTSDASKSIYAIHFYDWVSGRTVYVSNVMVSEDVATYEPYKSNILTVNEEVELRGIGDVQDTIDCLTGEYIQRVGQEVLNTSNPNIKKIKTAYHNNTANLCAFDIEFELGHHKNAIPISDKLAPHTSTQTLPSIIQHQGHIFVVRIPFKNDGTNPTLEEFKVWLDEINPTVCYELSTESIKTVDLSDNHVYSYKDVTHYDCSSAEGSLVPTLSVKVPTDVQATIAQQHETIQTLNSENERLNQIQEALKASMLDSQVQLMNLSWDIDFEVFTLRESIAPKDSLMDSKIGSNIDKFSQAKFIIENDCQDLEKLNSQIEYYFSKDVFSQEQFEELTDLISIVKGENGCEY